MEYKASLDSATKTITTIAIIIVTGVVLGIYFVILKSNVISSPVSLGVAGSIIIPIVVLAVSYLYAPQKYSVTGDEFIVHRLLGNRIIKLADIAEVRLVDSAELSGTIRTFGVGGF